LSLNKNFFFWKLLRPYVGVNSDFFKIFAVLGTLKIVEKIVENVGTLGEMSAPYAECRRLPTF
jgi:hypothetical protein